MTGIEAPQADTEPPLSKHALGGVAWNWGGSAILIAAQIASTAATARLLSLSDFGAYAAAQAAAGFAGYATLAAVGPGLQRRSHISGDAIGTALALALGASLLVATALWAGAELWAEAWGIRDAAWIVRVTALSMVFASTAVVPLALLRRELRFARAAMIETASVVTGLGVGVALAAIHHTAVALAVGQAAGSVLLLLLSGASVWRQLRLSISREEARELFGFASRVSGLNFLNYFINTLPSWFVARAFGASVLGFFSRANLIIVLPAEYAVTSVFKVVYPLYGRVRENLGQTKVLLHEALALTTGLVWPCFALAAGAAPVIVGLLLGDRWDQATPLVSLFALIATAWVPCWILLNAAEAFGWMRVIAWRQLILLAAVSLTLAIAALTDLSVTWLLVGVALCEWAVYLLTLQPFIRRGFLQARMVWRGQLIHAIVAVTVFGCATLCAELLEDANLFVQALGQAAVAALMLIIVVTGRAWLPATAIIARRLGVGPDESLVRAGWTTLR